MAARNKVEKLPPNVLDELEDRLARLELPEQIAEWLQSEGYDISPRRIAEHAAKRKRQPPPVIQSIRLEMKAKLGYEPNVTDKELADMFIRLGWLRLQEWDMVRRISGAHPITRH